jgi:serine protease Do
MTLFRSLAAFILALGFAGAAQAADEVPQSRVQIHLSFAPVVKQVAPAVVNIYTRRLVTSAASPLLNDPFFRQFFGNQMGVPRERVERSLGSGVIVRADGMVITNFHVIKDSQEITVVLSDRREFEAHIVGTDEGTDLAVLKIDVSGEKLPVLQLGDSDSLQVGDLVLAIGNPFGVGQTVTMGIVSGLARTAVGGSDYRFFIQTDAAINPGNSGGALVDLEGQLVGINSAIYTQSGGSIGIGFAIPANLVKVVLKSISSGGHAIRPWLGATGQPVTADMFQPLKLDHPMGVLVNRVQPNSPAARAGIKVGDVITAIDGHAIDDPEAMRFRIATLQINETAQVSIVRQGEPQTLAARMVAPPDDPPRQATDIQGRNPFSGARVENINPAVSEEMGTFDVTRGVIVTEIRSGSIAERLQIRAGDILLKVNDAAIGSVDDLRAALLNEGGDWNVTLKREGKVLSFTIQG